MDRRTAQRTRDTGGGQGFRENLPPSTSRQATEIDERKIAVLFGINDYADPTIPHLDNAIADTEMLGKVFSERLGYDVRVVRNPTRADIIRTLNQLLTEVDQR